LLCHAPEYSVASTKITRRNCGFLFLVSLLADKAATKEQTIAKSSGQNKGEQKRGRVGRCIAAIAISLLIACGAYASDDEPIFDLDIPSQNAAVALEQLAEQTGAITLFPYELAEARQANAVIGRFTLSEALELLLRDTGLSGGLSDKRVISILQLEEAERTEEEEPMKTRKKGFIAVLAGVFAGSAMAAQDAPDVMEEIVVKGVRSSLARALDQKRQSTGVYDAIVAKDIGEFPDLNISESLQRIPGVTITRNLGEGEQVSVRGLAPQFTGVLINGMQAASAAQGDDGNISYGRALTFDLFPSELFTGASVYKTPTAALQDGGLSATVDMRVPRPFDYPGLTFSTILQASENDLAEETQPAASLLVSNTSADGRFGALFQAAYSETVLHGELAEGLRFDSTDFDLDGDTIPEFTDTEYARLVRTGVEQYDRDRIGFTGALQFRPSDTVEIIFDVMYGETERARERHTLDGNLFGNGPDTPLALTVQDGLVVAGTFANELRRTENIYNTVDTDFSLYSLSGTWDVSDTVVVGGKIGVSDAEFARDEVRITYGVNDPEFSYDLTGDRRYPVTGSSATIDLTDPAQFTLSQVRHHPFFVEDDNFLAQFDIRKTLNDTGITAISGGAQLRNQERTQNEFRQDRVLGDESFLPFDSPLRTLTGVGGTTLRGIGFNIFSGEGPTGLLRDFAVPNQRQAKSALIDPNFAPAQRLLNSYVVEEEILAAYIKAEFETGAVSGDFGLRYATTDQSSSSYSQGGSGTIPVKHSRDYDNLLPSLNVRWELSEELLLRFAASIGMTRPTLSQINPSQNVQLGSQTVVINNPDLNPFEANQFDVALEWYFDDESMLAFNYFYKDIDALVTRVSTTEPFFGDNLIDDQGNDLSGQDFLISRLVNGDGAKLNGFEISYQQPFTFLPEPFDGFGVLANYTYADSASTVTFGGETFTAPIEGQSEKSFILLTYYEKGGFSARAAYHWRDDFLIIRRGNNENRFQEDTGYLDLTLSYNFNDNFKVSFDASNLTDEDSYRYDRTIDRNIAFAKYGRVLSLRAQYIMQ
jgi:TonB-dependent receptor